MHFDSTLPPDQPELMRVSAFRRYLEDWGQGPVGNGAGSQLSTLSPSLLADLSRFRDDGLHTELLAVAAASMRHARPLAVHLRWANRVVPLTLFPRERLAHAPVAMHELLGPRLSDLQVLHVEPALLRTPGHPVAGLVDDAERYHPLAPVTWELALRGARDELLPEIAGQAAYRVAPGLNLRELSLGGALQAAVRRLQRETSNLREISAWPGFDRSRAMRMLNALYLQAGLIISRTHPAAINEGWFGGGR